MLRFQLTAVAAVSLLLMTVALAACGGGDSKKATPTPSTSAVATGSAEPSNGLGQPSAADQVLPTPTKAAADDVALSVVNGKETFLPKVSEFSSLPTAEIKADKSYTGVTLATLGEKVKAAADAYVTVQGVQMDGKRMSILRLPLSNIGSNTALVIDDSGHLSLVSSSIPKEQWLMAVTSVAFQ
ncbi:MAG: hypothetical protein ABI305_02215 [Tepidiformaceae bacterium]